MALHRLRHGSRIRGSEGLAPVAKRPRVDDRDIERGEKILETFSTTRSVETCLSCMIAKEDITRSWATKWRTGRACYGLWNVWRASWSPSSYCGWIRAVMDWKMRIQDYITKCPQDPWYDHISGRHFAFNDYAKVITSWSRSSERQAQRKLMSTLALGALLSDGFTSPSPWKQNSGARRFGTSGQETSSGW